MGMGCRLHPLASTCDSTLAPKNNWSRSPSLPSLLAFPWVPPPRHSITSKPLDPLKKITKLRCNDVSYAYRSADATPMPRRCGRRLRPQTCNLVWGPCAGECVAGWERVPRLLIKIVSKPYLKQMVCGAGPAR